MFAITQSLGKFYYWVHWCSMIYSIWPECPQDHLLNNYDMLQEVSLYYTKSSNPDVYVWLRENMPVASFLQVLKKGVEKVKANPDDDRYGKDECKARNLTCYRLRTLNDTISSLSDILRSGRTPEKPSRWRLAEWRDQ